MTRAMVIGLILSAVSAWDARAEPEQWKPYSPPCVERENLFEFTEKPKVAVVGPDRYEITFAVKGNCDVTVGIMDTEGKVTRHLASGVLGANAPSPFLKNSLKQALYWNGKDDLDEYVKEPGKCRVRVMLGLKPEFDKRLGGVSPHNIPGKIVGLASAPDGVYIWSMGGRNKSYVRHYDFNGKYVASLVPPPASMPEAKLAGLGYVEYEPGKKAVHAAGVHESVADHGNYLPLKDAYVMEDNRPVIVGNSIYYMNSGAKGNTSILHFIHTDGSTELAGVQGRILGKFCHVTPRLAASPDGQHLYLTGLGKEWHVTVPVVMRLSLQGNEQATAFCGVQKQDVKWQVEYEPGSDERHLNAPHDVACDGRGRVYVCDSLNNRVQVFSPGGKFLHMIPVDRPDYICVHQKTGAVYVQHAARVQGSSRVRVTKFASAEDPKVVAQVDGPFGMMALDNWSDRPRLWFACGVAKFSGRTEGSSGSHAVQIWEEAGDTFKKIMDFDEMAKAEDGAMSTGRWPGCGLGQKVVCDPTREQVCVSNSRIFDLKTGGLVGHARLPPSTDDIAFDKFGYLHAHVNPGFNFPGIVRLGSTYSEVPYDYGEELGAKWHQKYLGVLPVKDQPGAKFFQDGIGVNMRGDVAEECNIYFVPKMDDVGTAAYGFWPGGKQGAWQGWSDSKPGYRGMLRQIEEDAKQGISTYSIPRSPGVPLAGGTIWTFDRSGKLRQESAVIGGNLINGVQIDEDGKLYFTANRPRAQANPEAGCFLAGQGGTFGDAGDKGSHHRYPFMGTYVKSRGENVRILVTAAPITMDQLPKRAPDVFDMSGPGKGVRNQWAWVEGAEWLYAGSCPIVPMQPCSCPTQRAHLDWYKRSYIPEAYRHSIGIVDTGGNLIMHLGEYGNFDDGAVASGQKKTPITMAMMRFVSGTDNYLCYEDNGERIVVLKLNYHAEETLSIK